MNDREFARIEAMYAKARLLESTRKIDILRNWKLKSASQMEFVVESLLYWI